MALERFRFQVGAIPCMVVADGISPLPESDVSAIFKDHTEQALAAFRELPQPVAMSANVLYLESAGKRILIDTGIGVANPEDPGQLINTLCAENIDPESINTIIISHYHLDHIGGLLDADNDLTFPNARLVVPVAEHTFWMDEAFLATRPPERAQRLRRTFDGYAQSGGLVQLESTAEIEPGVRYFPAFGHTGGHSGVLIESNGERLFHIVDTVHIPFQLNLPDAIPSFDMQPQVAITTRHALLERAVKENWLVQTYHFAFPGLGHIQQQGDQLAWIAYNKEQNPA